MKAPFPYFGGKSRVATIVWQRFGNPRNYIEPFAGSLAVLLARHDWENAIETVNDKDCYLANFWRALSADPEQVAHFADWPVNECDLHARHNWLVNSEAIPEFIENMKSDPDYYDAKVAGWWVWGISQWIGSGWCVQPEWFEQTNVVHMKRPHLSSSKGICRKLPLLGNGGVGVHSAAKNRPWQTRPNLSCEGTGIHRKRPLLSGKGGFHGVHAKYVSGGIYEYFEVLSHRLRRVRVCCGDWKRITGPAVTTCIGETAVFLDPPYTHSERDTTIYSVESDIAAEVRAWAIENGDNPALKIALCGYEGEHAMPDTWECVAWKANGGYGAKGKGRGATNSHRERIWFSPYCFKPRNGLFSEVEECR